MMFTASGDAGRSALALHRGARGYLVKTTDDDEMSLTQTGHAVGTPWYMPLELTAAGFPPEQEISHDQCLASRRARTYARGSDRDPNES